MALDLNGFEDIDSAEVKDNQVDMYKPSADNTDRLGFPLIHPKTKKVLILPVSRFKFYDAEEDKYHTFIAPNPETKRELYEQCLIKCGDPEKRWVTVVMVYDTNKEGKPKRPLTGELMGIRLSAKQVKALKKISTIKKGLDNVDLLVDSDNPDYMAMDFQATEKALWRSGKIQKPSEFDEDNLEGEEDGDEDVEYYTTEEIIAEALEMAENLDSIVAYTYPEQKVKDLLGLSEKSSKVDEDDDDLDDDLYDEDDEEEDEKPAPKKSTKKEIKKPAAKKRAEEDEDDLDEDDFDDLIDDDN